MSKQKISTTLNSTCLWCKADLPNSSGQSGAYQVVRCQLCGTGTTLPKPTPSALNLAYANWYRPYKGRFSGGGDKLLRFWRSRTVKWINSLAPPGPVLDIGCGDGTMLDTFAYLGRRAVGLERKSDRADVLTCDLADCPGNWSAIVLWHSLEHMPAPRQTLGEAVQRLAPGGIIVIAVPNFASLQAHVFGERWFHLDLPRHLGHLTPQILIAALQAEGVEVTQVSYRRGGQVVFGWLQGLVGLLPTHPDLYQTIRRSEAREVERPSSRWLGLIGAVIWVPVAMGAATWEVASRRGGTVCLVGRKNSSG